MITLVRTCGACPEQYDVFYNDDLVGYMRLRHGYFRVDFGFCGGDTIYESDEVKGDGCFEDEERDYFLSKAKDAIIKEMVLRGGYERLLD